MLVVMLKLHGNSGERIAPQISSACLPPASSRARIVRFFPYCHPASLSREGSPSLRRATSSFTRKSILDPPSRGAPRGLRATQSPLQPRPAACPLTVARQPPADFTCARYGSRVLSFGTQARETQSLSLLHHSAEAFQQKPGGAKPLNHAWQTVREVALFFWLRFEAAAVSLPLLFLFLWLRRSLRRCTVPADRTSSLT